MAHAQAASGQRSQEIPSRTGLGIFDTIGGNAMNTMSYKGYTARIEFDERDNIFVGRVLGISAIIGFHGETVAELHRDFEAAIDFMLEDCRQRNVAPQKPASGKLMIRVSPELHAAALVKAQSLGKSLNQLATDALSREISA